MLLGLPNLSSSEGQRGSVTYWETRLWVLLLFLKPAVQQVQQRQRRGSSPPGAAEGARGKGWAKLPRQASVDKQPGFSVLFPSCEGRSAKKSLSLQRADRAHEAKPAATSWAA